jgi:hypothetical protein
MGIILYNMMPTKIKHTESFRDFKQRLKLLLLDHPFYSLNEFLYLKKTIEPVILIHIKQNENRICILL